MKAEQKQIEVTDALMSMMEKFGASWGFTVTGDKIPDNEAEYKLMVSFDSGNGPGWSEVESEIRLLQEKAELEKYRYDRLNEYPNLADQLDMLWHAIDSGSLDKDSEFYTTIKSVKDNNPKPV